MKINVKLNSKSIDKAIERLQQAKSKMPKMIHDFLYELYLWFVNRANTHLDNSDIGKSVIEGIKTGWSYSIVGNTLKIINTDDKAVFVEFGVGFMGQQIPHPNASETGYDYDIRPKNNHYWVFYADDFEDVDMHEGYLVKPTNAGNHSLSVSGGGSSGGYWIITKGSWGDLYAYQTLVDLQTERRTLSSIWRKVKVKHWG